MTRGQPGNCGRRGGLGSLALWSVLVAVLLPARTLAAPPGALTPHAAGTAGGGCVVLLHGLGRTSRSMARMAEALQAAGYAIANIDYPSREWPVEHLAPLAVGTGIARCEALGDGPIHFVTHSLGGIVVRHFLAGQRPRRLGRVVMLSPPNQGSEAADALKDLTLYELLNGPAGQQLGTGGQDLPQRLGPVDFPLGVITGDEVAFFDVWLAQQIPGPSDGKVSVERAKVEGMSDFLVLHYAHPFIMQEPETIAQTLYFLEHGVFRHAAPASVPESSPGGRRMD